MPAARVEAEICAALRGEPIRPADPPAFVAAGIAEGLAPLLLRSGIAPLLPADAAVALRGELHHQLALTAVREPELRSVLSALSDAGVDVLVMKGAHLAHAFYDQPALRPRQDADLLVRPAHRDAAVRALIALGYAAQPAITGAAVQGQTIFDRPGAPAAALDVHWRLSSPIVAADLFDFDVLWSEAQPLPALGPAARAPHVLDAVAIAAVHQVAHHASERGLAWMFDLHVLLRTLDDEAVRQFVSRARDRKMRAVCRAAIHGSHERFPTAAGARLLQGLSGDHAEPSAALLAPRRPAAQALMDLRALRGWRSRAGYVAAHLFPPAAYMRTTYAPDSAAPLAWLYARRIARGGIRWISGPAAAGRFSDCGEACPRDSERV